MLPDSIPESLWSEFRKSRKRLRKPMTEYAETLILAKLERWRIENGANPVDILNEAIEKGWTGVWLNGHGAKLLNGTDYKSGVGVTQRGLVTDRQNQQPSPTNACKRCGTTQWSSLDRYKICERCQETTR